MVGVAAVLRRCTALVRAIAAWVVDSPHMPRITHPADAFAVAAARACAWLEILPNRDPRESDVAFALRQAREPLVHFAEVFRPGFELASWSFEAVAALDEFDGLEPMAPSDLLHAEERYRALPFSYYRDIDDGHRVDFDSEPTLGDLCDDALDIWRDLRGPLALWNAGHRDIAAWYWKLHFESHIGKHLVHAMQALHEFLHNGGK